MIFYSKKLTKNKVQLDKFEVLFNADNLFSAAVSIQNKRRIFIRNKLGSNLNMSGMVLIEKFKYCGKDLAVEFELNNGVSVQTAQNRQKSLTSNNLKMTNAIPFMF